MSEKQLVEVTDRNGKRTRRWKRVDDRGSRLLTGLPTYAQSFDSYKKRTDRYHDPASYAERQTDAVDHDSPESIKKALMGGEVVSMVHENITTDFGVETALDFDGSHMAVDPGRSGRSHPVTAWIASENEGIVYADQEKFKSEYTTEEGETFNDYFMPINEDGNRVEDGELNNDEYGALQAGYNRASEYDHSLSSEGEVENAAGYVYEMTFEEDQDD